MQVEGTVNPFAGVEMPVGYKANGRKEYGSLLDFLDAVGDTIVMADGAWDVMRAAVRKAFDTMAPSAEVMLFPLHCFLIFRGTIADFPLAV